jgi:CBS domain containing-hemolysin-like protein
MISDLLVSIKEFIKFFLDPNELVMFLTEISLIIFIVIRLSIIKKIKGFYWLLLSFIFFSIATFFTLVEVFYHYTCLNFLEHVGYLLSISTLFMWEFFIIFNKRRDS